MALPIKEIVVGFINTKKTFLANFISNRPDKEKQMMLIFLIAAVLGLDYFFLAQPCISSLFKNTPEIAALKSKLEELTQDRKNRDLIEKNWKDTTAEIEIKEKAFITSNELPMLLENLSKLALDSRVKIISLQPVENFDKDKELKGGYSPIPIKIDGLAGTHELGRFLARLESGQLFFRVKDMHIHANPQELKKHLMGLDIEAYKKTVKA